MRRRFLNLVVEGPRRGLYSLRRIPSNRLFYPSTRAAEEAMAKLDEAVKAYMLEHHGRKHAGLQMTEMLEKLPRPMFTSEPTPMHHLHDRYLEFASLLGDENKILSADNNGHTVVFDAEYSSVLSFPHLNSFKNDAAISLYISSSSSREQTAVEDGLYVIDRSLDTSTNDHCFEVLHYSSSSSRDDFRERTPYWVSLPPPPFAGCTNGDVASYTVVDGSTIYICSNQPAGSTYAFNTVSREWRRMGCWKIPVFGKAEYAPELKLWLGLSGEHPYRLCAFDLSSDAIAKQPPTVQHTWVDLDVPETWLPFNIDIINLGCGKFCVVKMFRSVTDDRTFCSSSEDDDTFDCDPMRGSFAVLTGLQMVRRSSRCKDDEGEVRMIKHKSICYRFGAYNIEWVL